MRSRCFASAVLAFSLVVTVAAPAYAQQDEMRARGDRACNGDAKKLCSRFFGQGDMAMLQCFQEHKGRLSRSCHKFLTEAGQLH